MSQGGADFSGLQSPNLVPHPLWDSVAHHASLPKRSNNHRLCLCWSREDKRLA